MPPNGVRAFGSLLVCVLRCRCLWAYLFTSDISCCFCNLTSQQMRQIRHGRSNKRQTTSMCLALFAGTLCVCVSLCELKLACKTKVQRHAATSQCWAQFLYNDVSPVINQKTYCSRQFTYRFAILNDKRSHVPSSTNLKTADDDDDNERRWRMNKRGHEITFITTYLNIKNK